MTRSLSALSLLLALPALAAAGPFGVAVTGGKTDQTNVVCTFKVPPGDAVNVKALRVVPGGQRIAAQTLPPSALDPQDKSQYVVFVLPTLKAGATVNLSLDEPAGTEPAFAFTPVKDGQRNLTFGGKNVLGCFQPKHDPNDHFYTFKPFHHVFDPATGEKVLTNGSAKTNKDGQFPHHRGLFFGFNRISYGNGQTADIWHGHDKVYSQLDETISTEVGGVAGRQRAAISWHGKDGVTFAAEQREVTAYAVPGGTMIDWTTAMTTKLDKVRLDGDPQHAGFHFRANQELSKKDTYYLRPDGKGTPGAFRNWDAKGKDTKTVNLPWNALSMVTGGTRYTVLRINHPDNPKETRGSERDYGRFGDYFEYDLTPASPLKLRYRVWVQEGEMTVEQCNALAAAFVSPPETKAK
jgi:hypothetical protein